MSKKPDSEQIESHISKLREERIAREKARIEKLRQINLNKYNKNEPQSLIKRSVSNTSVNSKAKNYTHQASTKQVVKNNFHVNTSYVKRPATAPVTFKKPSDNKNAPPKDPVRPSISKASIEATKSNHVPAPKPKVVAKVVTRTTEHPKPKSNAVKSTKTELNSTASKSSRVSELPKPIYNLSRASTSGQPQKTQTSTDTKQQNVFERLYKPKVVPKDTTSKTIKLQTDPNFLKKVITDSNLIMNKRSTMLEKKTATQPSQQTVRRSISAIHFKRISKSELPNCINKWASVGEKMNKVNLQDINEDSTVSGDVVVSAVKSERKRVQFQSPMSSNYNTPRPDELQSRLQAWLQKRGKSLNSFHHLQCFGIHHMSKGIKPLEEEPHKFELYDDENKENVPLESDSDDDSYTENMNGQKDALPSEVKVDFNKDKWRKASIASETATDYNESTDTITSSEVMHHVDDLLLGALNDLTELLREGFDWEQCARWLRAIRDRFPSAPDTAAYWECRAALEETRGDLPASVQCWEEAIVKGTQRSVVEANLDQLLDKFLHLHISPSGGQRRPTDTKMVDVKNVFKSTIIRFAVQQAKLRESNQGERAQAKFTVTPVRRSARLSRCHSETPLRICATVRQACELGPAEFVPNRTLTETP